MPRQEVLNILITILAVCQDPGFEVSEPFCQESGRNLLSKHHGKVLVNLQKKLLKSLQPSTHFQYFYASVTESVNLKYTLFTLKINKLGLNHMHFFFITKPGVSRKRGKTSRTVEEFCWS